MDKVSYSIGPVQRGNRYGERQWQKPVEFNKRHNNTFRSPRENQYKPNGEQNTSWKPKVNGLAEDTSDK